MAFVVVKLRIRRGWVNEGSGSVLSGEMNKIVRTLREPDLGRDKMRSPTHKLFVTGKVFGCRRPLTA